MKNFFVFIGGIILAVLLVLFHAWVYMMAYELAFIPFINYFTTPTQTTLFPSGNIFLYYYTTAVIPLVTTNFNTTAVSPSDTTVKIYSILSCPL